LYSRIADGFTSSRLLAEPERIPCIIGDVLNLADLIVMGEDDRLPLPPERGDPAENISFIH
jgi:hypothetical protein